MCGFVGCMRNDTNIDLRDTCRDMNAVITHRGPDDEGYFHDEHIDFGFRRLSIIGVETGHQPLSYENDRYWIVFNGEIYNYIELRNELIEQGYTFKTEADTEVIIALYSAIGEEAVKKLRGMFGFLIWDKQEKQLFGARDPFGIKPFFYAEQDDVTYFASEKKSILLAMEGSSLDKESLQQYLSFQYVPDPKSMTAEIVKLLPGHCFTKKLNEKMNIQCYWKPTFKPTNLTESQAIEEIRNVLTDSVNIHMRSDVPVGSFLSGGIDSSIIVSLAKEMNPNLKTFSVGFERDGFSEIDVAKETAAAI